MAGDTKRGDGTLDAWTMGSLETAPSGTDPVDPLSVWVKVGLTGLFLALATPLVGLGGLWATALLGQLAAEVLELSHATLPTFPILGDWDLRLAYLLALVAMGLRAGVSRLPAPRWTVAGLGPWSWWLLAGAALWVASTSALAFEQHVLDIEDGTHLVLLGGTAAWTSGTTIWLLASAGHASIVRLTLAARRSQALGYATAISGVASIAVLTPVLANAEPLESDDVLRDAPVLASALAQLDQARHDLQGSMHAADGDHHGTTTAALPPAASGTTTDARYTPAECMEKLATKARGGKMSAVSEVIRNVERRLKRRDLARDIVHTKLIDICQDRPVRDGKPLVRLLQKATSYGVVDVLRGDRKFQHTAGSLGGGMFTPRCLVDGRPDEHSSFEELQQRRFTVETALGTLSDRDQRLIRERYYEGKAYAQMALARGQKRHTINRGTTRAVERLGKALAAHCH